VVEEFFDNVADGPASVGMFHDLWMYGVAGVPCGVPGFAEAPSKP
jgi:hypothetical protein